MRDNPWHTNVNEFVIPSFWDLIIGNRECVCVTSQDSAELKYDQSEIRRLQDHLYFERLYGAPVRFVSLHRLASALPTAGAVLSCGVQNKLRVLCYYVPGHLQSDVAIHYRLLRSLALAARDISTVRCQWYDKLTIVLRRTRRSAALHDIFYRISTDFVRYREEDGLAWYTFSRAYMEQFVSTSRPMLTLAWKREQK